MAEWFSPTQSRGLWREASESDLLVTGSLSGRFKVMGSFPGLALNRIVRCKQLRPKIQEGKEPRGGERLVPIKCADDITTDAAKTVNSNFDH